MKRTIKTIFCAAAAVLAAVSCQKSTEPVQTAEEGKGTIDVRVNGLMGEYNQQDGVKSSLVNTVRVAWAAGDLVYVFDGTNYLGRLTAALDKKADGETDEDRYAKLSGTISAPATTPCTLTLVHSSLMTEPAAKAEVPELSIDMSTQSTDKVPFVAYATMDYTGTAISDAVVPFQFATAVIKVNCTGLKANTAITSATLTNVNTACKLTLSGIAAPTVSGDVNGTITRTGDAYFAADKMNDEGEAVFQIAVPKLDASEARVLTVAQGSDKFKDKNFSKKAIGPAMSVNTVCQLVGLPAGALPGEFTVNAEGKKVHFSKGNLYWDGDSFEFETNQYDVQNSWSTSHVSLFFWSKDEEVAYAASYSESGTLSTDVFFTNAEEETAKVAFTVNGIAGKYRTLSKNEWKFLISTRTASKVSGTSNARFAKATVNEQAGIILLPDTYEHPSEVTALTNINSTRSKFEANNYDVAAWGKMESAGAVFLPAAGYRYGSNVKTTKNGYWSSSAYDEGYAYYLEFGSGLVSTDSNGGRDDGYCVRLITMAE